MWNGFLVFAVDGTKVEVPNSPENKSSFGESRNHSEHSSVRALVSSICDVYNDFILDIEIASITTSERILAMRHLTVIKEIVTKQPSVIMFDRGYLSLLLLHILEKNHIYYIQRLVTNTCKKEVTQMRLSYT